MTLHPYEILLDDTWKLYGDYLQGSFSSLVCVVHTEELSSEACSALEKSMVALKLGNDVLTYINPKGIEAGCPPLDGPVLFSLLEELDPVYVIAADKAALELLGKAYGAKVSTDSALRLFGRNVAAFSSLNTMFSSPESKQKAWALLKNLTVLR